MKLTPLQFSFCVSVLVHGAALSIFYVVKHAGADANLAPVIGDLGTVEIRVGSDAQVDPISEPQTVPVLAPIPQPAAIDFSMVAEAKLEADAEEIIPPTRQNNPMPAEMSQVEVPSDGSQEAPLKTATPACIPSQASYLSNPKPVYPKEARKHNEQGLVVLGVTVTGTGFPADVWVIQSSGHALLDQSAQTAVKRWQFVPARLGNTAIISQVQVPVRFRLSD